MNPHSHYNHPHFGWPYPMYRYHRGPRRIFWFLLGGLAATIWLKGKEKERRAVDWSDERPSRWWRSRERHPEGEAERTGAEGWKEEKERIAQIGSQATETVADVSEAALDTILSTVEMLKARITEHREPRQSSQQNSKNDPEPQHRI